VEAVYYKPQDEEARQEYLKAVDNPTINNEHCLKKVDYYKQRDDRLDTISEKLKELEEKFGI